MNAYQLNIKQIEEEEKKDKRRAFLISLLWHTMILLLLLLPFAPLPQEDNNLQGIMVSFGSEDGGETMEEVELEKIEEPTNTNKKEERKSPAQPSAKSTPQVKAKTTSDVEPSKIIAAEKAPIKVQKEVKEIKEKITETPKISEADLKKEREAEQKRKEAEQKKQEEEQYNKAKSQFGGMFSKSKGANGGKNPQGDPNSKHKTEILDGFSTGQATMGGDIGDRDVLYTPKITDKSQKTGIVVINLCVDQNGKVVQTDYTQKGSTTTDSELIAIAIKSAKKYKFSPSDNLKQCGKIQINFKLK